MQLKTIRISIKPYPNQKLWDKGYRPNCGKGEGMTNYELLKRGIMKIEKITRHYTEDDWSYTTTEIVNKLDEIIDEVNRLSEKINEKERGTTE